MIKDIINNKHHKWLITGAGGFIGSNLCHSLLLNNQTVIGYDIKKDTELANLKKLLATLPENKVSNFSYHSNNINDSNFLCKASQGVDYILHQAAIASVPLSFEQPELTNQTNINSFCNLLEIAARNDVKKVVYASSSAVYGSQGAEKKRETMPVAPQSPYALSKYANEQHAKILGQHYGIQTVGLRYFNIYGHNQSPDGPYAAVIPKWLNQLSKNEDCRVFGDGKNTRDFCHIADAVQANIRAALHTEENTRTHEVFNIGSGEKTSLIELFKILKTYTKSSSNLLFEQERQGDIKHSCADINKAKEVLSYNPEYTIKQGLKELI